MKPLLLILSLILCIAANATTYYVSTSDGNDGNSGTAIGSEWKTLSKVNASMSGFHAGDFILLKRGDSFFGNIMPTVSGSSGSPITVGAYGTGAQPVVTALKTLTFSASGTTNVYTSNSFTPQSNPKLLTLNGVVQQIGRWPNASDVYPYGYLSVDNIVANKASNYTDITDNSWGSLTKPAGYATGGEFAFRMNKFRFVTYPITAGSMTTSGSSMSIHIADWLQAAVIGYGYFLQNHIKFLDVQGEWSFDDVSNKASVYLSSAPSNYEIAMPAIDNIVTIASRNYWTFNDITFKGANKYGFNISGGSNITIQNCTIRDCGTDAVFYNNTSNLYIFNSSLDGNFVFGVKGFGDGTVIITGNTLKNTFPILGMGEGGNVAGSAIDIHGGNFNISHNYFEDNTYAAVGFYDGSNQIIERNIVNRPCYRLHDGGAFYTDNRSQKFQYTNRILRQNIVENTQSSIAYRGSFDQSNGLTIYSYYADKWTKGVTYDGNIDIDGMTSLYANDPLGNTWRNNFLINTKGRFIDLRNNAAEYIVAGNVVNNNVGFSTASNPAKGMWIQRYNAGSISGYGTFNNNYYVRPYSSGKPFTTYINGASSTYSLSEWQTATLYEASGQLTPRSLTSTQNPAGYTRIHINRSDTARTYFLGAGTEWYTSRGDIVTSEHITLLPFTAEGLILKSGPAMNDPDPDGNVSIDPNQPPPPPPVPVQGVIKIKSKYKIIHVQ